MPPSIKYVKARHEAALLRLPDVVSVGIGLDENRNPAIIVGLKRPNPVTESKLPKQIQGYTVLVRIVGEVKAH